MNLSTAIMLVNKSVRACRVEYDPDNKFNNNPTLTFKTLDPDLKKDDYVIVPTTTRHGMTVCKIVEIDVRVDFNSATEYKWIIGKVDKVGYDEILKQESVVLDRVAKAEENRIRAELAKSMGLDDVALTDLDIVRGTVALPQPSTPRGAGNTAEADTTPGDARHLIPIHTVTPRQIPGERSAWHTPISKDSGWWAKGYLA